MGRGHIHVPNACISIFGGIQPSRLRAYISDALKGGPSNDGLIQRFQLIAWPDEPSHSNYVDVGPNLIAQEQAASIYARLASLSSEPPLLFRFREEAQELFVDWLDDLENNRIRKASIGPGFQAHLNKFRKLIPALSLLFSLADGEKNTVSLRYAQTAADCCEYFEAHAKRMYSPESNAVPPAMELGQKLVQGALGDDSKFSYRELTRKGWTGLKDDAQRRAALTELEQHGWIRRINASNTEIYEINPRMEARHAGR